MKIVFYINILSGGGAERVVCNLANSLSCKHEVTVINSFKTDNEYSLSESVKHVYMDDNVFKSRLKKNISRIIFLRHYLKTNRPDVAISFMAEPNYRMIIAARGTGVKTIVSVRNDPAKEYAGIIGKFLGRRLLSKASGCVFQTEDAKKWFPAKLQKKSIIILNPVDKVFFDVDGTNNARHDIITCGRLSEQKNHYLLIKAFVLASQRISDNLIIYGDGPMKGPLKSYAKECGIESRITFAGQTSNVAKVLKNAKAFVLSSDYEGLPNALMEALASGAACISTNCPCGGPKMLIKNNYNGILVPVGDETKLADSIIKVFADEEFANFLSKNARNMAKESFFPDVINNQWEEYISSIVNK